MNPRTGDPGSLDRLHEIMVPPPVPWWPPAPAWYALGVMIGVVVAVSAWRVSARWSRNRYRRAALAELDRLEADPANPQAPPALAILVKRVALAAYPRERVASLSGREWLAFLDATGGDGAFTSGPGRTLEVGYEPGIHGADTELFAAVRRWIEGHRC
jgi:Domain of unknown function (DUF4381)